MNWFKLITTEYSSNILKVNKTGLKIQICFQSLSKRACWKNCLKTRASLSIRFIVQCDPSDTCSGNGTCEEDGSCKCSDGFYGDSCSGISTVFP